MNYALYGDKNHEEVTDQHRNAINILQEFIGNYELGRVNEFTFTKKESEFLYKSSYSSVPVKENILAALREAYELSKNCDELRLVDNFGLMGGDNVSFALSKIIKAVENVK